MAITVTESDFETQVIKKSHETPVLVDFWAPWCGPCRSLAPVLERAVDAREGDVILAKVNTDEEQRLAMYYRIEGLPTVIAFKNGKPVDEFVGLLSESGINDFLNRIADPLQKQAKAAEAIAKTDPAAAEKALRETLAKDPNQEDATLGLVRLLVEQNRDKDAADLLENLGPGNEHAAEIERLGALLWLRKNSASLPNEATLRQAKTPDGKVDLGLRLARDGKHQEALATLLAAGEADMKLASGRVKEAMVKIFQLIGSRSPLADEYRQKLTSLLY